MSYRMDVLAQPVEHVAFNHTVMGLIPKGGEKLNPSLGFPNFTSHSMHSLYKKSTFSNLFLLVRFSMGNWLCLITLSCMLFSFLKDEDTVSLA